jgi:hypothetical protein
VCRPGSTGDVLCVVASLGPSRVGPAAPYAPALPPSRDPGSRCVVHRLLSDHRYRRVEMRVVGCAALTVGQMRQQNSLVKMRRGIVAALVMSLGVATLVQPTSAAPASVPVRDLFDPSLVRDLRMELEPLSGWYPADWVAPEDFPDGWAAMSSRERDALIAQDPVLAPLAVAAAWDTIRFDTTNSIVLPARFDEVVIVDGAEIAVDLNGAAQGTSLRVGVRRKSSRALPSEADPRKIGMKVGFNDFVKGQLYRGVSKLSLENGGDVSPLHEGMAWQLHQQASAAGFYGAGYDPALASWSKVSMNGEYLGVYTSVEQRNKQFLRNRDLWTTSNPTTWMYKQDDIGRAEFDEGPTLEDGTPVDSPTVDALCFAPFRPKTGEWAATCPAPSDGLLDETLNGLIDMQVMLTQGAIDAFTVNDDAMLTKGKNFFFVDRTGELRRHYPWDLDAVFRAPGSNIYSVGSTTSKRGVVTYTQSEFQALILNHPVYRDQYNAIMVGLVDGPLSAASIDALFARVRPALEAALATDPYVSQFVSGSVSGHVDSLRTWIANREAMVRNQVAANVPAPRKADSTAPTVQTPALSAGTVERGATVTVTANVSDNAEVVSADVRVGSGAWVPMLSTSGSFGASSVAVTADISAPGSDGTYSVCVRATDSSANTSAGTCTPVNVATPAQATALQYTGASTVKVNTSFVLSARLTTTDGSPISGQTVKFVVNKVTYTAVTNSSGDAAVAAKAITKTGLYTISTSFAGASGYGPATAPNVTLSVVR